MRDAIDFPCSDTWAAWYAEQGLTASFVRCHRRPVIPTTPRGGFDEADYSTQDHISRLLLIIRQQRREIATLKASQIKPEDSRASFEGVE